MSGCGDSNDSVSIMKRKVSDDSAETTFSSWMHWKTALVVAATLLVVYLAWFLPMMLPFVVSEHQSATMVTVSYNLSAYIVFLLTGGGLILASLKMGFDKQLYHWIVLIGGIFVIVLGIPWLALEKVEITQNGCYNRTWFGLSQTTLQFADLREFRHAQERTEGSISKGPRPSKMVYVTKTGEEGVFLASYYPTVYYNVTYGQLLLAWALYGKGLSYPVQPAP